MTHYSALLTGGDEGVRPRLISQIYQAELRGWPAPHGIRIEPAELVARRMQTTAITVPLVDLRTTLF